MRRFDKSAFVGRFVDETKEHLDNVDRGLLDLEKDLDNEEIIEELLREIHTVKGTATMLEYVDIKDLAHMLEEVFSQVQKGRFKFTIEIIDFIFKGIDTLRLLVKSIAEGTSAELRETTKYMVEQSKILLESPETFSFQERVPVIAAPAPPKKIEVPKIEPPKVEVPKPPPPKVDLQKVEVPKPPPPKVEPPKVEVPKPSPPKVEPPKMEVPKPSPPKVEPPKVEVPKPPPPRPPVPPAPKPPVALKVEEEKTEISRPVKLKSSVGPMPDEKGEKKTTTALEVELGDRQFVLEETIRVSTKKVDYLLELLGEVVVNRNRVSQKLKDLEMIQKYFLDIENRMKELKGIYETELLKDFKDKEALPTIDESLMQIMFLMEQFKTNLEKWGEDMGVSNDMLELVLSDLERGIMKIRMLPLSTIFEMFPRFIRDITRTMGKKINLFTEGEDTELDKAIIDELQKPLIHLVRNAVDHGIETREERLQTNKISEGVLKLSAYQQGSLSIIEVEDDGRGIDPEVIKEVALRRGFITEKDLEHFGEEDVLNLIFLSGFSSKEDVSDMSGRGVGLDVVKDSIEKLKGQISIQSKVGVGTKVTVRIPITLSLTQSILVRAAAQNFAIPLVSVQEVTRITTQEIETTENREIFRLRGRIIPLYRLTDVLSLEETEAEEREDDRYPVIIVGLAEKRIGIMVDALAGKQMVAIKNFGDYLEKVKNLAGTIFMADGSIVLVLDVPEIIRNTEKMKILAREARPTKAVKERVPEKPVEKIRRIAKKQKILIAEDSPTTAEWYRSIIEEAFEDYEVKVAVNGMEAYEKVAQENFDLIVSDVLMPKMNGFELTAKLKKDERYKHVPIIIITSLASNEDKKKGLDAGADNYLVKSVLLPEDLIDSIERLIG